MNGTELVQFSAATIVALLVIFYGGTLLVSARIGKKDENADGYMTAGNKVGFGVSAASMTATWIWASSLYASATSGYTYGISGPIHYGLWGALMILFIYPFGKRIRAVAPKAHTLAEVMFARHGRSSQLMLAGSNLVGSLISLMSNFIAGGVLISLISPFGFVQGVVFIAAGVLLYTLWSGFRASVLTDFMQVVAMLGAVVVIIPAVFFITGFPDAFDGGSGNLTDQQSDFFSSDAFLNQGAPYIAAVLAYAIGNQTIAQRLFAVREDLIKPTFVTATIGYGATVIGVGMFGVLALYLGIDPMDGDVNNIVPQMVASFLPTALVVVFFVMIIGALSSTADSDLSALSSIVMADIYGQNIAGGTRNADPKRMLFIGRATMVVATAAAVAFASMRLSILDLLVFVGALWGALVFPVIASFYWHKVTNKAFTTSVLVALAAFLPVRFGWFPMDGVLAWTVDIASVVGVGVIAGLMAFGFFGLRAARVIGVVAAGVVAPFALGSVHDYAVLSASLVAYAVSTVVCWAMSVNSDENFDFEVIAQRVGDFDVAADDVTPETDPDSPNAPASANVPASAKTPASETDAAATTPEKENR
ncbi:sodium:solute symporter family protein [Rhodococcus pyridinivorans]|uniref:sodium:solute symporter family protein n=1 Tax=Rhodococcus pyridinivorans TaxID=103816 RepID=UPI001E2F3034|nr:sodium:solute symporter family protein [Rhodococcus pyridinivorans]UGQ56118.1 sodium:solute symporter family protein [Rhodococcus pyridinivorans]